MRTEDSVRSIPVAPWRSVGDRSLTRRSAVNVEVSGLVVARISRGERLPTRSSLTWAPCGFWILRPLRAGGLGAVRKVAAPAPSPSSPAPESQPGCLTLRHPVVAAQASVGMERPCRSRRAWGWRHFSCARFLTTWVGLVAVGWGGDPECSTGPDRLCRCLRCRRAARRQAEDRTPKGHLSSGQSRVTANHPVAADRRQSSVHPRMSPGSFEASGSSRS